MLKVFAHLLGILIEMHGSEAPQKQLELETAMS